MLTSQRILPVLIVFGVFAIPSVAKAQTNTTTVTISDPAANSPYKAGDPVFVTGTTKESRQIKLPDHTTAFTDELAVSGCCNR